jgi:hypothetical protein
MCDHLTHHGIAGRPRCPTCRCPISRAEVADATDPSAWYLSIRHRNVAFYLDFLTENDEGTGVERPFSRLGKLFRMPRERVKLIHRGRVVVEEERIRELATTGATLVLVGSKTDEDELRVSSWRGMFTRLWWWAAAVIESAVLWTQPLVHLSRAFFASVDPRWKADEERQ